MNVSWFLQFIWLCLILQSINQNLKGKLFQIRQKIDKTHHCAVDPLLRRKVSVEIKATAAPLFSLGRTAINKHHQHLRWKFATIIEKSKYIAIDWPLIYSLSDKVSWSIIRFGHISVWNISFSQLGISWKYCDKDLKNNGGTCIKIRECKEIWIFVPNQEGHW